MVELFANSGDPDQTPHSAVSDLGLHCLPVTRLGVLSSNVNHNCRLHFRFFFIIFQRNKASHKKSSCIFSEK